VLPNKTINGIAIKTAHAYKDGDFWHWCIMDAEGHQYDGHDFTTREEALSALNAAFDAEARPQ
jgi:hypothetical protein